MLGTPLMPWQQYVADVAFEFDEETGRPFYREVVVTVPRQSGKTSLMLATQLERALGSDRPSAIAYTAQTGWDARKKLIEDQVPMIEGSSVSAAVKRVLRGVGNEVVEFVNGSRLFVLASSPTAGHGKVIDLAVLDEAFADDGRREQAMLPAMATRPDAQMLMISTAGDADSVWFRRKVDTGRLAVENDSDAGIAYFEWSADPSVDVDDPTMWRDFMPALGHTIDEATVSHARQTMPDNEFRRAFCNVWTESNERVIPSQLWDAVQDPSAAPQPGFVFGVDAAPERSDAAIVASDGNAIEVVDFRDGVTWVPGRLIELASKHNVAVCLDAGGPVGMFRQELVDAGVAVVDFGARELAQACMTFYDAVADSALSVRPSADLSAAVVKASKRRIGDSWAWVRRGGSSPLVAASLALRGVQAQPEAVQIYVGFSS